MESNLVVMNEALVSFCVSGEGGGGSHFTDMKTCYFSCRRAASGGRRLFVKHIKQRTDRRKKARSQTRQDGGEAQNNMAACNIAVT